MTAALRQMGQQMNAQFSVFHHVLNRARWSPLEVSRRLLQVLVGTFVRAGGTVEIVIDETLERRWGRKISKRGHWRESLRSSKQRSVSSSGLRWITMALVVTLPWTKLRWALPFLSVLATTPKVSEALKQRHKTTARIAEQMVIAVRRWLPEVAIKVIGDGAYSVIELGLTCVKQCVSLIAPLRLDARLFAPPPPPKPHQKGRPRVVGKRLPMLSTVLHDPNTHWETLTVNWYGGASSPSPPGRRSGIPPGRTRYLFAGCSHVIPRANANPKPTSRPIQHRARGRLSKTSSSAGPSK